MYGKINSIGGFIIFDGIKSVNRVIDYIEEHITEEINCETLAQITGLSVYEFRRIFSFVVGMPVGEYIRKRRLSLAAFEIVRSGTGDISAIAEKYGYSNQSAFTTAFKAMHGVSPISLKKGDVAVEVLSKPSFELRRAGLEKVPIKVISTDDIHIFGFCGISDENDSDCCEAVWSGFYSGGADREVLSVSEDGKLYAIYDNMPDGTVKCVIGAKAKQSACNGLTEVILPKTEWAVFTLESTDDAYVALIYTKILYEWLPSAGLEKRTDIPTTEVYPADMDKDGFSWEIRIPIK